MSKIFPGMKKTPKLMDRKLTRETANTEIKIKVSVKNLRSGQKYYKLNLFALRIYEKVSENKGKTLYMVVERWALLDNRPEGLSCGEF